MVPCKACPIFHDPRTNCRVAMNQLKSGTLPEPWKSANRLKEIQEGKVFEVFPVKEAVPERVVAEEKGVFKCPVCEARREKEAAYQRVYMREWRKKK